MKGRSPSSYTAIQTEGGLLPPDLLRRISGADRDLPGITPDAYHLAADERLNEAINRSWNRLTGAWESFNDRLGQTAAGEATTQLTRQSWLLPLFQELGYGQLQAAKGFDLDAKHYPISHLWGSTPIHLLGASIDLDHRTPGVAGAAGMSPHGLVQEYLNRSEDHLWGFVSNGHLLRILRDNVSLTRQAFVEFDLQAIFDDQLYADFTIVWLLCHQSRVEGDIPEKCLLEQWAQESAQRGTRALDQLRVGVETAITELGTGFVAHPANHELRRRLSTGDLDRQEYYRQLLRLVYRLIFLFVAEDRELLQRPDATATASLRFRDYYSTARLRRLALDHRGSAHGDQWAGLGVVFAGLSSPIGQPNLGLPGLGSFLWSDRAMPDLDDTQLENRHLLAAVRALATVPDPSGRVIHAVDYRNLGSEELGSIYESLLELHPEIDTGAATFRLTTAGGHERKTTGSYYTPTSLITELLDSALDPVLEEAASAEDPETAILRLTVLDPACGSGHFLIAAAHRIARRLAEVRTGHGEPTPLAVRAALRDVVARCLHGIDINPMAVELCKVSLWMEAMEPGKPLTFLDHRIVCGNALLGTTPRLLSEGIPDEAFKALEGDDKEVVKALKKRNKQERLGQEALLFGPSVSDLASSVAKALAEIDAMPDDTVDKVAKKERRWLLHLHSDEFGRSQLAADAWCAAFVSRKASGEPTVTDAFVRQALAHSVGDLPRAVVSEVVQLASEYGFIHPHLAFPTVFRVPDGGGLADTVTGLAGGFDLTLGNPPWDLIELKEREFFAARRPEIAEIKNSDARKQAIVSLEQLAPTVFQSYLRELRHTNGTRHLITASGRYPLSGRGRVNTYAAFVESSLILTATSGGCGLIVPTGIATDDNTKVLFAELVGLNAIRALFDFVNDSGLFPGVGHGRQKFCLLSLSLSRPANDPIDFAFFVSSTADLSDPSKHIRLNSTALQLLNPNTLTAPIFRSQRDADLTTAIYQRLPILVRDGAVDGNPWGLQIRRVFNMGMAATVRLATESRSDRPDGLVPMYEGKLFHQFESRFADYSVALANSEDTELPRLSELQRQDPCHRVQARYWIGPEEVAARQPRTSGALVAWRDVCRSTDERTVIASLLPTYATDFTVRIGFLDPATPVRQLSFLALINSFIFDFIARQMIGGTHLSDYIFKQLPAPSPALLSAEVPWQPEEHLDTWLAERALELSATSWEFAGGHRVEVMAESPFRWNASRREFLRAEMDAAIFHIYSIDRVDVEYVLNTFVIARRKEEAANGEFATRRLVLEVYDAMTMATETGVPYQTPLHPPPADSACVHSESTRPAWAAGVRGR